MRKRWQMIGLLSINHSVKTKDQKTPGWRGEWTESSGHFYGRFRGEWVKGFNEKLIKLLWASVCMEPLQN